MATASHMAVSPITAQQTAWGVPHTGNLSTWEAEVSIQSHCGLHNECQASLNYSTRESVKKIGGGGNKGRKEKKKIAIPELNERRKIATELSMTVIDVSQGNSTSQQNVEDCPPRFPGHPVMSSYAKSQMRWNLDPPSTHLLATPCPSPVPSLLSNRLQGQEAWGKQVSLSQLSRIRPLAFPLGTSPDAGKKLGVDLK